MLSQVTRSDIVNMVTHTAHYVSERLQKGCSYVAVQHCNIAGNISEMLQKSSYVRPCATLHEIFLQCFRDVIGNSPTTFRRFYSNFLATFGRFYMRPTLYRTGIRQHEFLRSYTFSYKRDKSHSLHKAYNLLSLHRLLLIALNYHKLYYLTPKRNLIYTVYWVYYDIILKLYTKSIL